MLDYKSSGVDIDAGNQLIETIKPHVKKTFDSNVIGGLGLFAGAYRLPTGYENPVLLSATDGVGTKLKLAIAANRFDTIGIDLVAMCVNDLLCSFAKPMFFLDYYACGKLEVDQAADVIKGIARGCELAECALVGGETAEMPGMYTEGEFDLAGFSVGIAEESDLLRNQSICAGDAVYAFSSSGIHSNGYSLVRKLMFEQLQMRYDEPFDDGVLIDKLLEPTTIYVREFLALKDCAKGFAHITGGGLTENVPRVLPAGLQAVLETGQIPKQALFEFFLQHMKKEEAYRTFNMGAGLIVIAAPEHAAQMEEAGAFRLGVIEQGDAGCVLV